MSDGEISPWLKEAIERAEQRRKEVRGLKVVVEVDPKLKNVFKAAARAKGFKIVSEAASFITVDIPSSADLDTLARMPGVLYVAYDKPFVPAAFGIDQMIMSLAAKSDPLLSMLTKPDLKALGYAFKPPVQISLARLALQNLFNPLGSVLRAGAMGLPVLSRSDWRLVTHTRTLMVDVPVDPRHSVRAAVIDSGITPHPAAPPYIIRNRTPEPPVDLMGHGEWVTTCAFGRPTSLCPYGKFVPVSQAQEKVVHYKLFTSFGGVTLSQLIRAMIDSVINGAKIVNMSLAAPLTGRVTSEPETRLVKTLSDTYGALFVVAAGNTGKDWSIGSPAAAPEAIAVAAVDWKTLDTASYSSRGPQGEFYGENKDIFDEDHQKFGDSLIKPDVAGIGGDVGSMIVSAVTGWADTMLNVIPDTWDGMIGTSMATPHVAGLLSILVHHGLVSSRDDVIKPLTAREKNAEQGYGLIKLSHFIKKEVNENARS